MMLLGEILWRRNNHAKSNALVGEFFYVGGKKLQLNWFPCPYEKMSSREERWCLRKHKMSEFGNASSVSKWTRRASSVGQRLNLLQTGQPSILAVGAMLIICIRHVASDYILLYITYLRLLIMAAQVSNIVSIITNVMLLNANYPQSYRSTAREDSVPYMVDLGT